MWQDACQQQHFRNSCRRSCSRCSAGWNSLAAGQLARLTDGSLHSPHTQTHAGTRRQLSAWTVPHSYGVFTAEPAVRRNMGKSESQMDIMEKSSKPGKRRWTVAEIGLSVLLLMVSCALAGIVVLYTSAVKGKGGGGVAELAGGCDSVLPVVDAPLQPTAAKIQHSICIAMPCLFYIDFFYCVKDYFRNNFDAGQNLIFVFLFALGCFKYSCIGTVLLFILNFYCLPNCCLDLWYFNDIAACKLADGQI